MYTVTATTCRTFGVVPKPVQDVACMTPMATHNTEVTGTLNSHVTDGTVEGEAAAVQALRSLGGLTTVDTVSLKVHALVDWRLHLNVLLNHGMLLQETPTI